MGLARGVGAVVAGWVVVVASAAGPAWGQGLGVPSALRVNPLTGEGLSDEVVAQASRRIELAIEALSAEAEALLPEALGEMGEAGQLSFQRSRPHDQVRDWPIEHGLLTLSAMDRRFARQPHADAYVRYHLLYDVMRMLTRVSETRRAGDTPVLPDAAVTLLIEQFERLPGNRLATTAVAERRAPRALWDRYNALLSSTAVVVGVPPYEDRYVGRAALRFVESPQRRAEIERAIEAAEAIRPRLSVEVDREAQRYNARASSFNRIVRETGNDLTYALIHTGSSLALDRVASELSEEINQRQRRAFDLLDALYNATFSGLLAVYDEDDLVQLRRRLERLAQRHREPMALREGEQRARNQDATRSFYDASFHLVKLLETPRVVQQFGVAEAADWTSPPSARVAAVDSPDQLGAHHVRDAIDRAIHHIDRNYGRGMASTEYHPIASTGSEAFDLTARVSTNRSEQSERRLSGYTLLGWALLASAESFQSPRLFERVNYIAAQEPIYTYNRAFRLQMLKLLPRESWRPWVDRDRQWLESAMRRQPPVVGGFPERYLGGEAPAASNAEAFYGVLGLWAAQEAGSDVGRSAWQAIDYHWRAVQQRTPGDAPAGWALGYYNQQGADPAVPAALLAQGPPDPLMTVAGCVALSLTERYLGRPEDRDRFDAPPGASGNELAKGLARLEQTFRLGGDRAPHEWYYRMWLIQRLGLATGIREFNGIDWVRDVTVELLNRRVSHGVWPGSGQAANAAVTTGFSLLYLGTILDPVAVSKLRLADAAWNNRPDDLAHFVDYASNQYEVETTFQVVNADAQLLILQDAPLLWLSTNQAFSLSDAEIDNLRRYIELGGMLVTNAESGSEELRSFRQLYRDLFPDVTGDAGDDTPLSAVPRDHDIFSLHRTAQSVPYVQMVDNGVRTLAVHFPRDIGRPLQRNDRLRSDAFAMLSNLYLYSVGYNPRRHRLEPRLVAVDPDVRPTRRVTAARVRHRGGFDPEPIFADQLTATARNDARIDLTLSVRDPASLGNVDLAMLTVTGAVSDPLDDAEAQSLAAYLERGGTLWVDAAGGSREAVEAARRVVEDVLPGASLDPLPNTNAILSGLRDDRGRLRAGFDNTRIRYRFYALRKMQPSARPRLQAVYLDGRPAIVFSEEDLTCGVAGLPHWGIFGYDIDSARRLMVNGLLAVSQ